jgi:predicted ATPase
MKFLEEIRLVNLLSYGPEGAHLGLEPLNVLIGPNASGKSNLIAALGLLAAAPSDLSRYFRAEGGLREWIWKGAKSKSSAEVEVAFAESNNLQYQLRFAVVDGLHLHLQQEVLRTRFPRPGGENLFFYALQGNRATLKALPAHGRETKNGERQLSSSDFSRDQSILSQIRDPKLYPELTLVGREFSKIRFFRDWDLSRNGPLRKPQPADLPSDFLLEDASNLGLVLSDLETHYPDVKRAMLERLKLLYERVQDFTINVQGGTVQIFFHEAGLAGPVPASRLSDGTLRYLCLLSILCHPSPPSLICLEEPELGLHPDAVSNLAELLVEAGRNTQLVVTTHSDALVAALSETPESIVVCEQGEGGTTLNRLEPDKLVEWLERYSLGDLWRMGQIGGNRW